jgi:hypothetical protein
VLTVFGYNLAADGNLTLFWQNLGGGRPDVWAGLTAVAGGETRSQRDPPPGVPLGERWVACDPTPAFAAEADLPGAILESQCPLATSGAPPGFYDLGFGLGDDSQVSSVAFPTGWPPVLIDADQRFGSVAPATAPTLLTKQGTLTLLNVAFGDTVSLAGYRLEPATWQAGSDAVLTLYWLPQQKLADVNHFRLSLRVSPQGAAKPIMTANNPVLPCLTARDLIPGGVLTVHFPLSLPAALPPGAYTLQVCLATPAGKQRVTITQSGVSQTLDCLPLSVNVVH